MNHRDLVVEALRDKPDGLRMLNLLASFPRADVPQIVFALAELEAESRVLRVHTITPEDRGTVQTRLVLAEGLRWTA